MDYYDWFASNDQCGYRVDASHLAVITTEQELSFLLDLARNTIDISLQPYTHIWIGASNYNSEEGNFMWINEESWNWGPEIWAVFEPSAMETEYLQEDCVALYPVTEGGSNAGKFNDLLCTSFFPSVCEIEM